MKHGQPGPWGSDSLMKAKVLTERWRGHYSHFRPHSSLACRPPVPEAVEVSMPGARMLMPGLALGLTQGVVR
jgi:hypothetical protein